MVQLLVLGKTETVSFKPVGHGFKAQGCYFLASGATALAPRVVENIESKIKKTASTGMMYRKGSSYCRWWYKPAQCFWRGIELKI